MTKKRLAQIDKRIGKIKVKLAAIGEMRPGSLTRQYKDPGSGSGAYYQLSYTLDMKSRTDTCQFETIIKARVPQLKYSDGTVEELTVPWAERYSRVTSLMEAFVLKLLEACQNTKKVCSRV